MSSPNPLSNDSPPRPNTEPDSRTTSATRRLNRSLRSFKPPVQFLGFWAAITLPFVLVTLLANGLDGSTAALAFLALLAVNVLALYVGHGYNR